MRDTMLPMAWVDVIKPGTDEIWRVRRKMLASGTGWTETDRDGCEYVPERGKEHVYALRSGFTATVSVTSRNVRLILPRTAGNAGGGRVIRFPGP